MRTWLRFNAVGLAGFGVQLAILELLLRGCGLGYMAASMLAVEAAILHNYFWHRRWTWAVRPSGRSTLVRFQLTQGLWSLVGTAAFMHLLVGRLGLGGLRLDLVDVVDLRGRRNDLEPGLGGVGLGERLRERPLLHHACPIGAGPPSLEGVPPTRGIRVRRVEPRGTGMPNSEARPTSNSVAAAVVASLVQGVS